MTDDPKEPALKFPELLAFFIMALIVAILIAAIGVTQGCAAPDRGIHAPRRPAPITESRPESAPAEPFDRSGFAGSCGPPDCPDGRCRRR